MFSKWHYQYIVVALAVIIFEFTIVPLHTEFASHWLDYWWMFPIALVIALIANTAGISGAALFVPFFILLFPFLAGAPLHTIDTVRLGLITESFGLSSSALAFLAFGLVDLQIAARAILGALPFVIAGVIFTFFAPQVILYIVIAILLIVATFLIRFKEELKRKRTLELKQSLVSRVFHDPSAKQVERVSKDGKHYLYYITKFGERRRFLGYGSGGFFQGAAGFGIGELGIISMMLTDIPTRIAIGTSHIIVATTAISASLLHFLFVSKLPALYNFPWNIPAMTIPAVVVGGQFAPYVASKLSAKLLENFVSALFVVLAMALILLAFRA